ncbi:MAG: hypothetical protein KDB27_02370, partial [Planctomycetales bacterium]|nr:hypothetical protein [Planctomycetales bacterium]
MRWKELLSSGTAFLLLLAIAFMAFNWLVPHLILWMRVPNAISGVYRFLHYAGALVGEGCVIVIFASLYWRHWLIGFLAGVVVFAAIVFGSMAAGEMFAEVDSFRAATALPAVTLAVSLPLLLIRIVRGWQLVLPGQTSAARESVGVRDLLIGMAVIAGTFAIMRLPFAHENNWDDLAFAALLLVAVAVSGSIVPLAAWFAL